MAPKPNNNKKDFKKGEPKTPITSDPRFSSVHNDPRFLRPKKKDTKVTIDKRFVGMMNSTEFSDAPCVDKYGRRLNQGTAEKELKRFYQLEDEDEDSNEEKSLEQLEKELAEDEENLRDEESQEEEESDEIDAKTGYDPMRGRGEISSSDEDTDDDSDAEADSDEEDEEDEDDEIDRIKHIQDGEETSRLACVNMDWDKIKAVDILKVLSGFKPDTGIIKSVTIYPSEFGKERLALEDTQGPPQEIFKSKKIQEKSDDSDSDNEEVTAESMVKNQIEEGDGIDFDQEALRKYQLDRLKYYYAVIECDTAKTAKVIYKSCDNTEYESSANFFDLRYIPESMTFNDDKPKDVVTDAPERYKPTKYKTDALQRTKVSLTWDEDDVDRFQVTRREFTEDDLRGLDFDAYLASSDEEEEEEDVDALREKYRKLLGGTSKSAYEDKADEEDENGDMEITFTPGLSEAAGAAVKNKDVVEKEETSIETYMRKQKEKRKAKKVAKQSEKKDDDNEEGDSDMDAETENDPFFKEAREEMADEDFVAKKDKKDKKAAKINKKKASKEEREEKARERAELELLMDDNGKSEGFNMKEVLKREKLEKKGGKVKKGSKQDLGQDDFEINVADPRFAAVQDSHHFAIDPTNPQFKKTKSMQKLMNARQTKMKEGAVAVNDEWKKEKKSDKKNGTSADGKKSNSSLSQLVASVKRKANLDKNTTGKRQKK